MPYIALQLVGMAAVLKALGLHGEVPLMVSFIILALYTYSAGLRAPALIAFVKDIMIYIVVIVAVAAIPMKLGGYANVFASADAAFQAKGSGGLLLGGNQYVAYATLAFGSALAAFMYPHTLTGILPRTVPIPSARMPCCSPPIRCYWGFWRCWAIWAMRQD